MRDASVLCTSTSTPGAADPAGPWHCLQSYLQHMLCPLLIHLHKQSAPGTNVPVQASSQCAGMRAGLARREGRRTLHCDADADCGMAHTSSLSLLWSAALASLAMA